MTEKVSVLMVNQVLSQDLTERLCLSPSDLPLVKR